MYLFYLFAKRNSSLYCFCPFNNWPYRFLLIKVISEILKFFGFGRKTGRNQKRKINWSIQVCEALAASLTCNPPTTTTHQIFLLAFPRPRDLERGGKKSGKNFCQISPYLNIFFTVPTNIFIFRGCLKPFFHIFNNSAKN